MYVKKKEVEKERAKKDEKKHRMKRKDGWMKMMDKQKKLDRQKKMMGENEYLVLIKECVMDISDGISTLHFHYQRVFAWCLPYGIGLVYDVVSQDNECIGQ